MLPLSFTTVDKSFPFFLLGLKYTNKWVCTIGQSCGHCRKVKQRKGMSRGISVCVWAGWVCDEPAGGEGEGRSRAPAVPDPRGRCDHSHATTLLQSCLPLLSRPSTILFPKGWPRPVSRASTHRSLSPHSSQQWPLLVISRADSCCRDSQCSPDPMLQLSPRRLPPRAGARSASCPTANSSCPVL